MTSRLIAGVAIGRMLQINDIAEARARFPDPRFVHRPPSRRHCRETIALKEVVADLTLEDFLLEEA
jgi:hypothetical protein